MQEQIDFIELEKSLLTLKTLTEKMSKNLGNINALIKDNINSGAGVWDSSTAKLYCERWNNLIQDFPAILTMFQQQETNLGNFIENMKKADEA